MQIGRRIYYDNTTGEVILDKGEMEGDVLQTTDMQDIFSFPVLSERNRDSFDYIDLDFGAYADRFKQHESYKVDAKTKRIIFL
ncbi:hypothetical protein LRR81_09970 [Metabacillus sp. GX 13764]|uniref:hypothetical protein n=1 Tax=Metabacillus kandeliae TaxID=2900151 RepID=UPI001E3258B6|nr:hypothetical protein [Metabacillus kandeliae]MCD7034566.1 hypothetical protein [Metabacillus kandeliae]